MAYSKRIAPIRMILTDKEYNILVETVTECITNDSSEYDVLAKMVKEKMFKYSIIKEENKKELIETKLYINEAMDLISLLLIYVSDKVKRIDYCQVLKKMIESQE